MSQWIPRSVVLGTSDTDSVITPPPDHPMLQNRDTSPRPSVKKATLAKYKSGELAIKISFPYDRDDVANVKNIPGRKYHGEHKVWTCPVTEKAVEMLREFGFEIDPKLDKYLEKLNVNINDLADPEDIEGLKMELFPYQKKGVAFVQAKNGRALIADEMGLGKTAQALAWLQMNPNKRPALVVVPASLKLNWEREAQMWMKDPSIEILSGTTPYEFNADIVIINYDILVHWLPQLSAYNFEVLIADEIHYIKNNGAKRTKAVKKIAKQIPHFIGLSGTPIVNRPYEFYNAIKLVDRNIFPDFWHYVRTYCGAFNNGYGWDFSGATNTEELHEVLTKSIMIRRRKAEVLTELPDKIRSFVPMPMFDRSEYDLAESDFIEWVRRSKGKEAAEKASNAATLASIEGLKQLAVKAKMPHVINWIEDFLQGGEKLVIFATHHFVIDLLMDKFRRTAVKIDGSTKSRDRQHQVDLFQNVPEIQLFVGNIKAAGVGITLTASSNIAFLELPWTPGDLVQAEDRCHRIGQKDAVNIHYLLAEKTIEEKIAGLLDQKRVVLDAVLDGTVPDEKSLLTQLIHSYI